MKKHGMRTKCFYVCESAAPRRGICVRSGARSELCGWCDGERSRSEAQEGNTCPEMLQRVQHSRERLEVREDKTARIKKLKGRRGSNILFKQTLNKNIAFRTKGVTYR